MASRAREHSWFKHMNMLRRHMVQCKPCRGAVAASYPEHLCLTGTILAVKAAKEFDAVLAVKCEAHKDPNGFVYACPDVSLHGEAYALYAEPLTVIGKQESLF